MSSVSDETDIEGAEEGFIDKGVNWISEEEELTDTLTVKDNLTKEEKKIELDNLIDYLDTNI